uniref:Secreted protein n=1 Tax=Pyxicephalus adspersus TaxID=30357 RepID=A0AAV2ZX14_PYXAD|nr:TPA: hypothetical protein GDO54_018012 [Pyxicephalus adspersus]
MNVCFVLCFIFISFCRIPPTHFKKASILQIPQHVTLGLFLLFICSTICCVTAHPHSSYFFLCLPDLPSAPCHYSVSGCWNLYSHSFCLNKTKK